MIQLLTFDLDNTLWNVDDIMPRANKAMREWIRQEHEAFAARFDFRDMTKLLMKVAAEQPTIAHDFTQLRLAVLRAAFLEGGYSQSSASDAAQGAFEVFFRERNRVDFFPDVMEGLTELKKNHALYSISNGNADVALVGLGDFFTEHFSAISVGYPKPDPRIFQAALEASGHLAPQTIHIGDDPELDVAAAAAVGMKTVWVNYEHKAWPSRLAPPDGEIRAFAELPKVVEQVKSGGANHGGLAF